VCPKTCSGKFNCDYWGAEEDYSCKSLEEEYGCDCSGCACKIDHMSCANKLAKKKCNGKSCDEWILLDRAVTCALLEKDFKCSCSGCACKPPPICDAKAKKFCSDAFKQPCITGKQPTCGACIKGYASDGKYGCGAWVDCKALGKIEDRPGTALDQPKCGRKFKCRCEAGKGAEGLACPVDGNDKCASCNPGYVLDGLKCVKITTKAPPKPVGPTCSGVCGAKQYKGDGNCDDGNNVCGCDYDGGDCCAASVKGGVVKKNYCKTCACLDPKHQGKCKSTCGLPKFKGDGHCDDENNNCGCAYDAGDCCGPAVVKKFCKECKCKDPKYKAGSCTAVCGLPGFKGDGNCDDENNNCGCAYDGGDCCGVDVKKTYCKVCKCLDPDFKPSACGGSCGSATYKGDGNCDDDNNNCGCDYDGGDCCGPAVKTAYCKECKCKDPKYKPGACPGKCGLPAYKGDGNCDDENNVCGCGYDGGDCCAASVKGGVVKKNYCKACSCLDPKSKPKDGCAGGCGAAAYKGDGNCDDENNNCGCAYDGGDCCGPAVKTAYCKECKCKDPKYKPSGSCKATCGSKKFRGDGICDDENNNCGCGYDDGDCCAKSVKGGKVEKQYCKICACKDPKYKGTAGACSGSCGLPKYKGDGTCDDENNSCGCDYDGGDCCAKSVKGGKLKLSYCKQCKCLDPKYK